MAWLATKSHMDNIIAHVNNIIRTEVPSYTLDEIFKHRDVLSKRLKEDLTINTRETGYSIIDSLITDIKPDAKVIQAMNEINTQKRRRTAAEFEAETEFILGARGADTEAYRKRKYGEGIRDLRNAVLDGYKVIIKDISTELNISPEQVLTFVKEVQHMDMQESIGKSTNTKILFVNDNNVSTTAKHDRNAIVNTLSALHLDDKPK